jgi:hypothetical protein
MPDRFIPFMLAVGTVLPSSKINVTRIIEAVVIAIVCAAATSIMTTKVLETKMDIMEKTRVEDRTSAIRERAELKDDLIRIRCLVEDHILKKN